MGLKVLPKLLCLVVYLLVGLSIAHAQDVPKGNTRFESFSQVKKLLLQDVWFDHRQTIYCQASFDAAKNVTLPAGFTTPKHHKRSKKIEWATYGA
ncbi:MAG: hypothetical protein IJU79_07200 [Desulfovibrionaceae bacterium]|nr:hypothetical protein [Desulfovibrionaceae bacterium]